MDTATIESLSGVTFDQTPGYKLLAQLGKKVLRPGGAELTSKLLGDLAIGEFDDVVELAPGMGSTTARVLVANPASYTGVDRDPAATNAVAHLITGPNRRICKGSVSRTGLEDASVDVAFGEAYLTMHPTSQKLRILAELARVLRPGGRLGLHEVAFWLDDLDDNVDELEETRILTELRSRFKVDFSPLTIQEWTELLDSFGFDVHRIHTAPLRLLEPQRIIADEGYLGAARFAINVLRDPQTRKRIFAMQSSMRRNAEHLRAFVLVATRREP